jgi:nicotinamide-nucleotide amidase
MVERFVLPALQKCFPARPQVGAHLHFVGVPESVVDDKIRPIIQREKKRAGDSIQFTILAHLGLVDFDVFVSSDTLTQARRTLRRVVKSIRRVLGEALYGMDADYPLEKVVGDQLRRRDATLAVAESCTGGLLAARVTNIPGSSDYFLGGSVTYANAAKVRELGVPESLLHRYGAVSKPVALAMARGVRERAGSTWGVGITGIAGPGGGTRQKPVGLVFIAVASVKASVCQEYRFTGDRAAVRERAVLSALDLLRKTLGRTVQKSL